MFVDRLHRRPRPGRAARRPLAAVLALAALAAPAVTVSTAPPASATAPATIRISVRPTGPTSTTGLTNGGFGPRQSRDASAVAFTACCTEPTLGDTNFFLDAYVRVPAANVTSLVSVPVGGGSANGNSFAEAISGDGRYVVFRSAATNLHPDDPDTGYDLYLRDRTAGTTTLLTRGLGGAPTDGTAGAAAISADGRWVAFAASSSNLVPGDTNGTFDVFLLDRNTSSLERVSVGPGGAQSGGQAAQFGTVAVSDDGRYVAFESTGADLVPGDTNGASDVFVRDRTLGVTERVSVAADGSQADLASRNPAMTPDGRYVAFESDADGLTSVADDFGVDVYVRDRAEARTELVSVSSSGEPGEGDNLGPSISADGRYVAFESDAENLVPSDENFSTDVFVRDRLGRVTERASVRSGGSEVEDAESTQASLDGSGRFVALASDGWLHTSGEGDGTTHVYRRDRGAAVAPAGSRFTAVSPQRLLDTRGANVPAGWPAGQPLVGRNPARERLDLPVAGVAGVPADATAVVVNVTSTQATSANGFVTVWPAGEARPEASNLNLQPGASVPNLVTVKVGAGGRISLFTNTGTVHLIVDLAGYYAPDRGSALTAVQPQRLLDTRGANVPAGWPAGQPLVGRNPARERLDLPVAGVAGVPADATAVVVNVTSTQATSGDGFVTVWPAGESRPLASNLNLQPGASVPNLVTVKVGAGGRISLFTNTGTVHLIVDLAGYYTADGDLFFAVSPARVLDTRTGKGAPKKPVAEKTSIDVAIGGQSGSNVPGAARAVVLNVTSTEATTTNGFTTVWPTGSTRPNASNLNYRLGVAVPNAVVVGLGPGVGGRGSASLYNGAGSVHLVADANGYFR